MKKLQVVLGKTTLLACMLAVTAGGCSKDKTSEKSGNEGGGAAGESDVAGNAGRGGDSGGESSSGGTSGGKSSAGGTSSTTSSTVSSDDNGGGTSGSAGSSGAGGATAGITALSVKVEQTSLRGLVEQTLTLDVTIDRGDESAKGEVTVSAQGLPAGVGSSPVKIATGNNKAQLQIKIGPTAQVGGPYPLSVVATSADDSSVSNTTPLVLYVAQKAGALDISFGNAGTAQITPGQGSEGKASPQAITVDSKGRVVVGGGGTSNDWVVRLTSNGTLDTTFAKTGVLNNFGLSSSSVYGVAFSNEQLYVAASQFNSGSPTSYYLRKVTETGTTDPAFNSGLDVMLTSVTSSLTAFKGGVLAAYPLTLIRASGAVDTSLTAPTGFIASFLAPDSQDRILYIKSTKLSASAYEIGRMLSTGEMDNSFGTNGVVTTSCPTDGNRTQSGSGRVTVQSMPDQSVMALVDCAKDTRDSYAWQAALVAFSSTGQPIRGFGNNGRLILADPGIGGRIIAQPDGKIVVFYSKFTEDGGSPRYYVLTRYNSVGVIDASFGDSGTVKLGSSRNLGSFPLIAYDSGAQRVVVASPVPTSSSEPTSPVFEIKRFWL